MDDGIAEIPDGALQYFKRLEQVRLPASLKRIGASAFSQCSSLKEITLPDGLKSLGDYAFQDTLRLRLLSLPASLTELGEQALYIGSGSRLSAIRVAEGNPAYASVNGVLFSRDMTRLIKYPSAKRVAEYCVLETVREIAGDAFAHTNYLHRVTLPAGFTQLDYASVGGNKKLEELVIPEGVTELNNSALIDDTGLRRVILPSTLTAIWDHAFQRCASLEEIVIPENVEYIDDEAFLGCTGLRRVLMKSKHIKDDRWLPEKLRSEVTVTR